MKYKLTGKTFEINGHILHRIEALKDFADVKKGELGGWIEKESNLSQEGDCWVYGYAQVRGNAWVGDNAVVSNNAIVCDDAEVYGDAKVCGNAKVYDNAEVSGNAEVYGDAKVSGNAKVYDNAEVSGNAVVRDYAVVRGNAEISGDVIIEKIGDYIVFQNWWSSGRFFTYTKSNKMWTVGCFYGTGEELIKKAYSDSEAKGKCYSETVRYIENIFDIIQ